MFGKLGCFAVGSILIKETTDVLFLYLFSHLGGCVIQILNMVYKKSVQRKTFLHYDLGLWEFDEWVPHMVDFVDQCSMSFAKIPNEIAVALLEKISGLPTSGSCQGFL